MARIYSNDAHRTTVASPGIDDNDTSIPLATTVGWPVPSGGDIAIAAISVDNQDAVEIISYTGISTNTLTGVSRGLDGTTASSHAEGALAWHVASAKDIEQIYINTDDIAALDTAKLEPGDSRSLVSSTDSVVEWDIIDDASPTSGWPDRWQGRFAGRLVFWLNEFFEMRGMPSAISRVAFRLFAALDQAEHTTRSASVAVFEVANDRERRDTMFSINKDGDVVIAGDAAVTGDVTAANIGVPIEAVINDASEVPGGTPSGTIFLVRPA